MPSLFKKQLKMFPVSWIEIDVQSNVTYLVNNLYQIGEPPKHMYSLDLIEIWYTDVPQDGLVQKMGKKIQIKQQAAYLDNSGGSS